MALLSRDPLMTVLQSGVSWGDLCVYCDTDSITHDNVDYTITKVKSISQKYSIIPKKHTVPESRPSTPPIIEDVPDALDALDAPDERLITFQSIPVKYDPNIFISSRINSDGDWVYISGSYRQDGLVLIDDERFVDGYYSTGSNPYIYNPATGLIVHDAPFSPLLKDAKIGKSGFNYRMHYRS